MPNLLTCSLVDSNSTGNVVDWSIIALLGLRRSLKAVKTVLCNALQPVDVAIQECLSLVANKQL